MPARVLKHHPNRPASPLALNAYVVLCNAHEAAGSFLAQFVNSRRTRKAKGTSTNVEQDLLRAMLVFASSGLDSMVKHLIRDTLSAVIDRDQGALEMLKESIRRNLYRDRVLDAELLVDALVAKDPKALLIEGLVYELTSSSLQSSDQLFRVASFFNIPTNQLTTDPKGLGEVFNVRNEISHEMDIDFSQPNRNRRPRSQDTMIAHANTLFSVGRAFLERVDEKLP